MPKKPIGTECQYNYIKRYHRHQTALEMGKALKLQESYVYKLCLELEVVPLSRVKEDFGKKKQQSEKQTDKPTYTRKYLLNPGPGKKIIERPPAVYTNSPSPFGIADELHGNNIKTDPD